MIYLICIGCFLAFILIYIWKNKLHIKFNTFFKKGFKKLDNKFGLFLYTGKQRKRKNIFSS